jgi:branched-chain amino acid transport system substrate-binding protein
MAGCAQASSGGSGDTVSGDVLRIYSSQPLRGALAPQARALVRGEQLALEDARGRAGKWRIDYRALNDADPLTGTWEPGMVSANARQAAQDDKAIAYLGEMGTGASAVAIPILNETKILEVSPTDTITGFTRRINANPGEPEKYYPTKDENFARLVPPDDVQAAALLQLLQDNRSKRVFVVHDQDLYGQGVVKAFTRGARAKGIEVVKVQGVDAENVDPARLAGDIATAGGDAFLYAGEALPQVPPLYAAVAAAAPRTRLYGTYTQVNPAFAGRLAPGATVLATAPWLDVKSYGPAALKLAERYRRRFGEAMPPHALYGYEAMSVVLAAIRSAGKRGNDRPALIKDVLKIRRRDSVLGTYAFDRRGDVTIKVYGSYRVRRGSVAFERVLDPLGA